jgi:DNA replication and repair protein RecF
VRSATVDGKPRRARDILGLCPVVLFTPDDLQLVSSGPERRRRLLDTLLGQLNPLASIELIQFRRVLAQRNALLRQIRAGGGGGAGLHSFTEALTAHGGRVRAARATVLAALMAPAAGAVAEISGERDQLSLTYLADGAPFDAHTTAEEAALRLAEALARRAPEERARAMTLAGPHRDDIEITLGDHPARSGASQGQQRSVALALKLAEVEVVTTVAGMRPVLLLDDVLGELDRRRRDYLLAALAALGPLQLLVTTTAPAAFPTETFRESRTLAVRDGHISDETIA